MAGMDGRAPQHLLYAALASAENSVREAVLALIQGLSTPRADVESLIAPLLEYIRTCHDPFAALTSRVTRALRDERALGPNRR